MNKLLVGQFDCEKVGSAPLESIDDNDSVTPIDSNVLAQIYVIWPKKED